MEGERGREEGPGARSSFLVKCVLSLFLCFLRHEIDMHKDKFGPQRLLFVVPWFWDIVSGEDAANSGTSEISTFTLPRA